MLLLSFLTAINLASSESITIETINLVKELLHYFVKQYQNIFGLRHMTFNIHSLLHANESLKYIGPLWMYSTFNYEGIDKDLISTVHGTVQFAKQLIQQHVLFRDAIIAHRNFSYPLSLFTFNEQLLNRKASLFNYRNVADAYRIPKPVSSNLYDKSENGIATIVQSYFNDPVIFFHSVKIGNLLLKTTTVSYGKLFTDNCALFYFSRKQQKMGLIQAIVKSNDDNVRILIEELIEKRTNSSKLKIKLNSKCIEIPNTFNLYRSNIYHLKHPKWAIKKHAMIFRPDAKNWIESKRPLISKYSSYQILNSDHCSFQQEYIPPRTLSFTGERTTEVTAKKKYNTAPYFTVQPVTSADGHLLDKFLLILQEKENTFGKSVQKNLTVPSNVIVKATKSGKSSGERHHAFLYEVLPDLTKFRAVFPNQDSQLLIFPEGSTDYIQPQDISLFRSRRFIHEKIERYIHINRIEMIISDRQYFINTHSVIHNQLSAPQFKNLIQNGFIQAGITNATIGQIEKPKDVCFKFYDLYCSTNN
ncbi:unnamed protein product, partial [Rotaria magnacalcarata]